LVKKGYAVDAFECNKDLHEYSKNFLKSFNSNFRIFHSKPSEVPDDLEIYDAAIIGWGGYMHIVGEDKRVHFLKQFREHLKKDGPILLSFFTRNNKSRRHYWIYQLARWIRKLLFIKDNISIGDSVSLTYDHYFTESEIRKELEQSGFKLEFFSDDPYGHAVGIAE